MAFRHGLLTKDQNMNFSDQEYFPPRRKTRPVKVGRHTIGGDGPIVVQSMTKTDTRDVEKTV